MSYDDEVWFKSKEGLHVDRLEVAGSRDVLKPRHRLHHIGDLLCPCGHDSGDLLLRSKLEHHVQGVMHEDNDALSSHRDLDSETQLVRHHLLLGCLGHCGQNK